MKLKITEKATKFVTKEVEVKHRHSLSNYRLWKWGNGIMSWPMTNRILTNKGFVTEKEYIKGFNGWTMIIKCKICKKDFEVSYDHLRWETTKKTGEYLPA